MPSHTVMQKKWASEKHAKRWRNGIFAATLVFVTLSSFFFERIKAQFPFLITAQLWTYKQISRLEARAQRPKWVTTIEVDDDTFSNFKNTGPQDVTDRAFLAHLIDQAVAGNAAVIALDINLTHEKPDEEDPTRARQNRALFDAIYRARHNGIPVVLTQGLDVTTMSPLENIADAKQSEVSQAELKGTSTLTQWKPSPLTDRETFSVPQCAPLESLGTADPRAGFDEAPEDKRKVPLANYVTLADGRSVSCSSFALQVVNAYEVATGIKQESLTRTRLKDRIDEGQFVYVNFLDPSNFTRLSAADVYNFTNPQDKNEFHHRIVLIGGNRSAGPRGGEMLDYHDSPVGKIPGMYFQANYIEGLLDDRTKKPVWEPVAVAVDLGLSVFLIFLVRRLKHWVNLLKLLAGGLVGIVIVYVVAVNFGYALDCVVILVVLAGEVLFEHYLHLQEQVTSPEVRSLHREHH